MSMDNKTMFNEYVKYFPTIGKHMKLLRGGKIRVNDSNGDFELFDSWEGLNNKYQLFETTTAPLQMKIIQFKIWAYGDPNRCKDIKEAMEKKYFDVCGRAIKFELDFKKKNWVYFIDSEGNFCQSGNEMVINLLRNSSDWEEFKLPIKKFTKAEIAEYVGLSVDQFEIV